jgi:hypothetical protein
MRVLGGCAGVCCKGVLGGCGEGVLGGCVVSGYW